MKDPQKVYTFCYLKKDPTDIFTYLNQVSERKGCYLNFNSSSKTEVSLYSVLYYI